MSIRRQDLIAVALLAALVTIAFADVLFNVNGFYFRDIARYYHPAKKILREIVLAGEFPYWNPYLHAGQPMAANPEHEVFYPLTWLILLPDYDLAFQLLILLHLYIASWTMYALLRSMSVRPPAAFFGALAFALGGYILSCINLLPILFSVVWMPLTILYARRFLRHSSKRDFALASLFLGLQLIVGEPTTVLQTGILLGLYALSARPRVRRLAGVALLSLTALAVAAVQVLPTLDHFRDSARARGLALDVVSLWSMPPARLGELVYPRFFGEISVDGTKPYWGKRLYPSRNGPFLLGIYSGLLLTMAAFAGFFSRMRGRWLVVMVCGISTLFAFGSHTPLLKLLYDSGIARTTRFPEKFILMAVFALVVFGARALDQLLEGDHRVRRWMGISTLATVVFATTIWLCTWLPGYPAAFRSFWKLTAASPAALTGFSQGWLVAAMRGTTLLLLLFLLSRIPRRLWLLMAVAFTVFDLAPLIPSLAPKITNVFYRQPPAAIRQFPQNRHEFRIFHFADWPTTEGPVQEYELSHPDHYWRIRNSIAPLIPAAYGLRTVVEIDYDLTSLQGTTDFTSAVWKIAERRRQDWINPVAAMSNVWYFGLYERPEVAIARARGVVRDLQPVRFVEGRHHPRYYFASRVVPIRSSEELVGHVVRGALPTSTAFTSTAVSPRVSTTPASGTVRSWTEWNNGARIEVDASGLAFLVMSVTAHKYWRITIDGREVPAVVTNLAYQGVVVPAGRHVVEMRYRNPLIAAGGTVTGLALLMLAVIAFRARGMQKTGEMTTGEA